MMALCAKRRGSRIFSRIQEEADVMFNSALIYELACPESLCRASSIWH